MCGVKCHALLASTQAWGKQKYGEGRILEWEFPCDMNSLPFPYMASTYKDFRDQDIVDVVMLVLHSHGMVKWRLEMLSLRILEIAT